MRFTGRGTDLAPPNRFETVRQETDWEQLAADDELLADESRLPTTFLPDNAQTLIRDGKITHPLLGVSVESESETSAAGAKVTRVDPGRAGQAAGLLEKDVVVKVGDRKVDNADSFVVAVRQLKVGEDAPIEVIRDGKHVTLTIRPQPDKSS